MWNSRVAEQLLTSKDAAPLSYVGCQMGPLHFLLSSPLQCRTRLNASLELLLLESLWASISESVFFLFWPTQVQCYSWNKNTKSNNSVPSVKQNSINPVRLLGHHGKNGLLFAGSLQLIPCCVTMLLCPFLRCKATMVCQAGCDGYCVPSKIMTALGVRSQFIMPILIIWFPLYNQPCTLYTAKKKTTGDSDV
jgi:hypothetical protein